jgi:hypothetical protein
MGNITNAFHAMALGLECDVYFEYVRSAANVADMPSRQAMRELHKTLLKAGFHAEEIVRLVYRLPVLGEWIQPASAWVQKVAEYEPLEVPIARGATRKRRR